MATKAPATGAASALNKQPMAAGQNPTIKPNQPAQVATPQQASRVYPAPKQSAAMPATTSMRVARLGKVVAVPASS